MGIKIFHPSLQRYANAGQETSIYYSKDVIHEGQPESNNGFDVLEYEADNDG